jgi:hypothetical protein
MRLGSEYEPLRKSRQRARPRRLAARPRRGLAAFGRERCRELSDSGRPALGEEPKRRPVLRFHAARRVDRRAVVRRRSLRGMAGVSVRWCVCPIGRRLSSDRRNDRGFDSQYVRSRRTAARTPPLPKGGPRVSARCLAVLAEGIWGMRGGLFPGQHGAAPPALPNWGTRRGPMTTRAPSGSCSTFCRSDRAHRMSSPLAPQSAW